MIGDPAFGFNVDIDLFINKIIQTVPKLGNVIDTQIVLRDLYEVEFGIFNHRAHSKTRPLSSVAFHDAEDLHTGSLLEEAIRLYTQKNIGEIFKLSLDEYLNRPRDVLQMLNTIADEVMAKKTTTLEQIEKNINQQS